MISTNDRERVARLPRPLQNLPVRRKLALLATLPWVVAMLITRVATAGYEVVACRTGAVERLRQPA